MSGSVCYCQLANQLPNCPLYYYDVGREDLT
jgi:hypothetical protein